ncbi:MAG: DNA polymerase III subunit beta [Patescibacteria group bacterium]
MNFACTQENLLQGLSLVGHITGKNVNLPILSNVLLKTEEGSLKLCTTNLEMAVSALVRGRVEAPGEFTVPAKLLLDYVTLLSPGKVELRLDGDALEIKADGKVTKIKGMSASEFPLIPKLTKETGYKLDASVLRQAIGQVAFAVSMSESRPELSGVACYFQQEGSADQLIMAATDSYRLSERSVPLVNGSATVATKCIVPARAIQEVARALSAYKDEVNTPEQAEWAMAESQFVVTYGNVELVSRLIEGSFPDYKQIIPTQFHTTCKVDRGELAKAIRAASLFSKQGLYDVHLEIDAETLTVSSADMGTGTHTTSLKAEVEGPVNKVTLNFKYVNDGLSIMSSEKVVLKLIDGMNPVVITPTESTGFQYVVMPIRQ